MCTKNKITTPKTPKISIDSEISTKPIVNHQIMKNGFNALSKIPARNGPCLEFVSRFEFCFVIERICRAANPKSPAAPKIVIIVLISGALSIETSPNPRIMIKGNSTIVWPTAILIPEIFPSRSPYIRFAAKRGPGDITPDAEIIMTNPIKPNNSCM